MYTSPIRLLAFDLDGTVLNDQKQLTPRTLAALTAAAERGVALVPATGRTAAGLPAALLALPGVGRKSANLIMGDVFGKPAIVTDTHCIRLANRIGLVDGVKEPQKVEMLLWQIIPPEEGSDLCHRFVLHGRAVCDARRPACERCCLAGVCRTAREQAADKPGAAAE